MSNLDRTLSALADPTRRAIVARLLHGDARVTDVAGMFEMSLNGVSKHLRVLEKAGIVVRRVQGREHQLSFSGEPLDEAQVWIERTRTFWNARMDSLERLVRTQQATKQRAQQPGKKKEGET